jgi:hypothetical protein
MRHGSRQCRRAEMIGRARQRAPSPVIWRSASKNVRVGVFAGWPTWSRSGGKSRAGRTLPCRSLCVCEAVDCCYLALAVNRKRTTRLTPDLYVHAAWAWSVPPSGTILNRNGRPPRQDAQSPGDIDACCDSRSRSRLRPRLNASNSRNTRSGSVRRTFEMPASRSGITTGISRKRNFLIRML